MQQHACRRYTHGRCTHISLTADGAVRVYQAQSVYVHGCTSPPQPSQGSAGRLKNRPCTERCQQCARTQTKTQHAKQQTRVTQLMDSAEQHNGPFTDMQQLQCMGSGVPEALSLVRTSMQLNRFTYTDTAKAFQSGLACNKWQGIVPRGHGWACNLTSRI
jgi:hypothetical protein